jgi:hypothetical protein
MVTICFREAGIRRHTEENTKRPDKQHRREVHADRKVSSVDRIAQA